MNAPQEQFKTLKKYPHLEIGSFGTIRCRESKVPYLPIEDASGYWRVNVGMKNGHYIHRMVCEAFHGPKPGVRYTVNHRDGVKGNNRADNLEWLTIRENLLHAVEMGLIARGEDHHNARFTNEEIVEMRERRVRGETTVQLAKAFKTSPGHVSEITRGRMWPEAGGPIYHAKTRKTYDRGKLKPHQVREIRRQSALGVKHRILAEKYGVEPTAIAKVVHHLSWPHV